MTQRFHSRIELAKEQLEYGLILFLDHSAYPSAITLAGAAEEIFGQQLRRGRKSAALDWKLAQENQVFSLLHGKDINRKKFIESENKIRNSLKHFNGSDKEKFCADLEMAACWMLARACENASRLNITIDRSWDFNEWFYINVIGV